MSTAIFSNPEAATDVMQPGPAVSTRARAALGDISNRGLAGGLAGKAGAKVRRPPVPNSPGPRQLTELRVHRPASSLLSTSPAVPRRR